MVVVSLDAMAVARAGQGAHGPHAKDDHDSGQTRKQETKAGHVAN
jgi:hypothetical protein